MKKNLLIFKSLSGSLPKIGGFMLAMFFGMIAHSQTTPVFSSYPTDTSVECIEDVPTQAVLTATSDCDPVVVSTFESHTGVAIDSCGLTSANDVWSIWLPTLEEQGLAPSDSWHFQGNASYVAYDDNTARVSGIIENAADPSLTMHVEFWLHNGMDWTAWSALGRSYKDDLNLATTTHVDWTYYEMLDGFSHITGLGSLLGTELFMSHAPSNYYYGYQCGLAANDKNSNMGMSGWFTYSGTYDGQAVTGAGDLNVDKSCGNPSLQTCVNDDEITYLWHAEDACGNMANHSQVITVNDETAPVFTVTPDANVTVSCENWPMDVFTGIEATDNCASGILDIVYVGEFVISETPCESEYVRRWIATDMCDNSTTFEQFITVVDDEAPMFVGTLPDMTIECDDVIPNDILTATDNCSEPTVEVVETITGDECETILTRTFTATDDCGLTTDFAQTITIVDSTAPVFDAYDMEVSVPCDEPVNLVELTATDNCSTVTVTYEDTMNPGTGCIGGVTRVYTAVDLCGNTSTAQQNITFTDDTAPVINNPADMMVECDNLPTSPGMAVEVMDNCSDNITVTFEETIIAGDCADSYTILWQWTATDSCNNSSEATTTITVEDTTSPTWVAGTVPADATFECSDDIPDFAMPQAVDNCDDMVEVEMTEMIMNGDCPNTYTIERMYRGFDNCGNEVLALQTITVEDTTAPVFDPFDNLEMPCDDIQDGIFVTATDNCSDVTITVVDELTDAGCAGSIVKTYTATDACGNTSTATQTIVLTDDEAPVFDAYEPAIDAPCDEAPGSIYVTATDNCSDVTITVDDEYLSGGCAMTMVKTYTATDACGNESTIQQIISLIDDEAPTFTSFPADVTVECNDPLPTLASGEAMIAIADNCTDPTLTYEGTETIAGDCPQNYTITHTWKVIDECNNEDYRTWTITVEDTTPPVFTNVPETVELDCNDPLPSSEATAMDNCGMVTITYVDNTTGDSCEMITIRTFTAVDECGNSTSADQMLIQTDNTAPTLTVGMDMTLECDQPIPAEEYTVDDDCSSATVVVTSNTIAGQCPQSYELTRTYTATDACGNETVLTQVITVEDTTAPVFSNVPSDVTIDCNDSLPIENATATDNCGVVTVTYEDDTSGDSCEMVTVRTFTAVDECGNASTAIQTITQTDTTAPTLMVANDLTLSCEETVPEPAYTVDDDCSDVTVEVTSTTSAGDCPQASTITRTYTAMDACGNTTTMQQVITIEDNTAPVFDYVPADVTLDCADELPTDMATATDNCGAVSVTYTDATTGDSCEMITVRTFTAVDECNNASTVTQTITKIDTTAPTLTVGDDATINCDDMVPAVEYTVMDDCSGALVDVTEDVVGGDYCYVLTRTYIATDACGNSTTMTQTITVEDNVAPLITNTPSDQTYSCPEDVPTFDNWTVTDNCDQMPTTTTEWEYLSQDDCGNYVAVVTCTATDACNNSSSVSFMVTVQDMDAPVFDNTVADLVIDCDDEVPAPSDLTATDNCNGTITYTVSDEIIGDMPNPDALLDCDATTPATDYYDVDWGVMLYNGNTPVFGSIVDASFTEFPDGTAHLVATTVSTDNPNGGFSIDVWFTNGMDWANWSTQAFPTGYKDDFNLVGNNYLDWTYYILDNTSASMIGWGDYAGSLFTLAHAPANHYYGFQIGVGANNVNMNYGGGGWFTYSGIFIDSSTGTNEVRSGGGDFAWDGDCCPDYFVERTYCAVDCSGNETCFTQNITFEDLDGIVGGTPMTNTIVAEIALEKSFDFVSITPNPVADNSLIEYRSNIDTKLRLDVYDSFGNKVSTIFEEDVIANSTHRKYLSATKLSAGIYVLRLSSSDESTTRRIVVVK